MKTKRFSFSRCCFPLIRSYCAALAARTGLDNRSDDERRYGMATGVIDGKLRRWRNDAQTFLYCSIYSP